MEVKKKKPKFLRRTWSRYSKLGKQRKKKQIWKAPKGRDNKMREKRKGYPAVVSIGYKKPQKEQAMLIKNLNELKQIKKNSKIILGAIGKKKKLEIAQKAKEMNLKIQNLNLDQFLKQTKNKEKKKEIPKAEKKSKLTKKTGAKK